MYDKIHYKLKKKKKKEKKKNIEVFLSMYEWNFGFRLRQFTGFGRHPWAHRLEIKSRYIAWLVIHMNL